jgi:hypothetical protein
MSSNVLLQEVYYFYMTNQATHLQQQGLGPIVGYGGDGVDGM